LADLELVQRILQQVQLTLEVLHLLEKEKMLMEKTMEANMTALRSQINPHFLFNTLNTISSLIHDAPEEAEAATERLAFIFRHTLKFSRENFVSLGAELELVRNYLEIEQLRFGDRLSQTIQTEPDAREFRIPALIVQTVVENCIKHGIAKLTGPGEVRIDFRLRQGHLQGSVYNTGPPIDPSRARKGTGLNNVLLRVEELYDAPTVVRFEPAEDGTFVYFDFPPAPLSASDANQT
jgi:LytS/YehU family sensor histidine kinase